jgi:hypothetical protein
MLGGSLVTMAFEKRVDTVDGSAPSKIETENACRVRAMDVGALTNLRILVPPIRKAG